LLIDLLHVDNGLVHEQLGQLGAQRDYGRGSGLWLFRLLFVLLLLIGSDLVVIVCLDKVVDSTQVGLEAFALFRISPIFA
jgi:hypothetical protein